RTGYKGRFYIEPGRYVVAECGLLLGTVHATKNNGPTRYVGTDLGFNVLARPMMYDAHHDIEVYRTGGTPDAALHPQTVVGNICESGDIMAKERQLPAIQEGDILGVLDAGAYGYAMSSTYNQRLRPAEVLIGLDGQPRLIRRREELSDLMALFPDA
ncbi:MAG TPA: diaminopimelate decarboxylase, partial [Desulfovibrio sp.]|nr:diaminopimelate decarboxylase [Desulfovibrio sp.]